jgi:hypothetical protein
MEQSPSSEPTSHSATQGFPNILLNPRFITTFTRATTDAYPDPDESNPYNPIPFLYDTF